MSATRDQSQKFTFVYSNLYQIYRQGKEAAIRAEVPTPEKAPVVEEKMSEQKASVTANAAAMPAAPEAEDRKGLIAGRVIKAQDLNQPGSFDIRVLTHPVPELMGKRIESQKLETSRASAAHPANRARAVEGLRENLKTLQNLHERLRFMLKELEEISKKA